MIHDRIPLPMNEVEDILEKLPETEKKEKTRVFLKKFIIANNSQSKKIKSELEKLDLIKLKEEHIIKIIDIFPQDASDLNKIFTDVSLNEDETNKILEIVKNSK